MEHFYFIQFPEQIFNLRQNIPEGIPVLPFFDDFETFNRILSSLKRKNSRCTLFYEERSYPFESFVEFSGLFDSIFLFESDTAKKLRESGYKGSLYLFSNFRMIVIPDFFNDFGIIPVVSGRTDYELAKKNGLDPVCFVTDKSCIAEFGLCLSRKSAPQHCFNCDNRCREKSTAKPGLDFPVSMKPDLNAPVDSPFFLFSEKTFFPEVKATACPKEKILEKSWNYRYPVGIEILKPGKTKDSRTYSFTLDKNSSEMFDKDLLGFYGYSGAFYKGKWIDAKNVKKVSDTRLCAEISGSYRSVLMICRYTEEEKDFLKRARHYIYTLPYSELVPEPEKPAAEPADKKTFRKYSERPKITLISDDIKKFAAFKSKNVGRRVFVYNRNIPKGFSDYIYVEGNLVEKDFEALSLWFLRRKHGRRGRQNADAAALKGQAALQKGGIRRTERPVGGQFDGSALHEGARRHDDLILIAGHIPRLGGDVGVDGRPRLNAAAKGAKQFGRARFDRLYDIGTSLACLRLDRKTERRENVGGEMGGLQRLGHRVRRVEQAAIERFVLPQRGADFKPDAGAGQAVRGQFHGLFRAREIAAGLGHAAARIFDERADDKIGAHGGRLLFFGEFAVAVVDHDERVGANGLDGAHGFADLVHGQGAAGHISFGTLQKADFYPRALFAFEKGGQGVEVDCLSLFQFNLAVLHAEIGERSLSLFARQADDVAERVVGLARDGEQDVAGPQQPEQADGQRVRAVGNAVAHEGGLGAHDAGKYAVERVAAAVVVAVTGRAVKTGGIHALGGKGVHDAGGADARHVRNMPEGRLQIVFGAVGKSQ